MRNTKEKIISLLLALSMVLTSVPAEGMSMIALAAETEAAVTDETMTDDVAENDETADASAENKTTTDDSAGVNLADDSSEEEPISEEEPSSDGAETNLPTAVDLLDTASNDPAAIPPMGAAEETIDAVTINDVAELVALWKKGPAAYQNAVITIAPTGDALDLTGTDFNGLGSEEFPFQGSIVLSGSVSGAITLSCPLFQYLSQSATVGSGNAALHLAAAENMTTALLAEYYVAGDTNVPGSINLQISADSISDAAYSTFGGIIGTMKEGTVLKLKVTNSVSGSAQVSGTGNRGFICNTMEDGTSLTIVSYTGSADFQVTSSDGSAGGLVGQMGKGAALTLLQGLSYSGNVTGGTHVGGLVGDAGTNTVIELQGSCVISGTLVSTGAGAGTDAGDAGGLFGRGENTSVLVASGTTLTIKDAAVKGKHGSGGVAGHYIFSNQTDLTWDIAPFTVSGVTFATGSYAGGVFGVLENKADGQTLTITDSSDNGNNGHISSKGSGAEQFGGLLGLYAADQLTDTLALKNMMITSTATAAKKSYGGLIGALDSQKISYVKVDHVRVSVNSSAATNSYFGGLVALSDGNSMLDVGTVKVSGTVQSVSGNATCVYGGLVGALTGGVLRLHGVTDLSGISAGGVSPKFGQIVGTRTSALIYALGTGSDYSEQSESGWTLIRDGSEKSVSDVGSWGEVVRIDGSNLKEEQVTGTGAADEQNHLLVFNKAAHTVTIAGFADNTGDIFSLQNFAAIALSFQSKGASGSLILAKELDLSLEINFYTDINLAGTGITGFLRDNGSLGAFAGLLDGNGHTITMAVGETYGKLSSGGAASKAGCGQIYNHSYLGLFAKIGGKLKNQTAGVQNLTVDGTINFYNTGCTVSTNASNVYFGGIAAYQTGQSQHYSGVTASVVVTYSNGKITSGMPHVYGGGFIGYAENDANVTFDSCTWNGTINDHCGAWEYHLAGFIGYINNSSSGSVTAEKCNIKGKILASQPCQNANMGGFLASSLSGSSSTLTMKLENLTIDGLTIQNSANTTSGGLLGYDWYNVKLEINGLTIQNAALAASNAGFGGLVYKSSGYWKVHGQGISFKENNSIKGKSADATPSGLLVCRGDDYLNTNSALYMEIGPNAYNASGATVTLFEGSYFDEIVGITIGANGNGVVSIATDQVYSGVDQSDCNTYKKQLTKDYNNPKTRYYYNLDGYRLQDGKTWADNQVESGVEMLLWSVGVYCESNLKSYFVSSTAAGTVTIQGSIDLTGLSYYPVGFTGTVNIKDASITFGYEKIETTEKEAGNKRPSDKNKQHYMMQDGLFLTLTSTASTASSMNIGGTGLTLSGTIGQLDSTDYAGGSGALICGKANGTTSGSTLRTFTFSVEDSAKLVLEQLKVYNVDDYAPLLINEIGSYSSLNVANVSVQGYEAGTKAATSLIGHVGSETDLGIVLLFENMDLDGRSESSIFNNATFLESFSYSVSDETSSGTYNFRKGSTFTYGKELSNGVNGQGMTGRNPYGEQEGVGQVWYEDTVGNTGSGDYVSDARTGVSAATGNGFFTSAYLPYVHVPEGGTGGSVSWKHELDVNQLVVDILEGCGTYDDPYIIDREGQLETLGKFLSTGTISGWNLNIPYSVAANNGTVSLATDYGSHYSFTSGSTWTGTTGSAKVTLTSAQVRTYLRNAYYLVTEDLTLKSNFYGLGGADSLTNVFSGVIIGRKSDGSAPTLKIRSHTSTAHNYFGGLIAYSGGSVVKNIILDYSGEDGEAVSLTLTARSSSQQRAEQTFFGGVIGYVVGGDNIIDNVQVTGLDGLKLTIIGTDGKVNGANANLTPVGAYVGLVGGNASSGGGVVFKNLDSPTGFSGGDYLESSDYYYRNPYVGRVLDGYAAAENCTVDNTDKNYKIPTLMTKAASMDITASSITISSTQQLWVLSAIVNSGAGDMNSSGAYNSDAYRLGCVRTGTYDHVGTANGSVQDLQDCKYWGGISTSSTSKVSYLVYKYAANGAYLSGGSRTYSLNFTTDCDMTSFGNGFRGIGATYQDNNAAEILRRTLYLGTSVGSSTGSTVITIERNLKEYAAEQGGWQAQCLGLFPVVNFNSATTVRNLTIRGNVSISYPDDKTYAGDAAAGGFAGMTARSSSTSAVTFNTVTLGGKSEKDGLTVSGAKYSGGFAGVVGIAGRVQGSAIQNVGTTVGAYTFENCSYDNIHIQAGYTAGGLIGLYRNSGRALIVNGNVSFENSEIGYTRDVGLYIYQTTKTLLSAVDSGYSGAGGLVGYCNGGAFTVGASTDTVSFENIKIYGPKMAYNNNYGLGGLAGVVSGSSITATGVSTKNVTVEVDLSLAYTSVKTNDQDYYNTAAAGLLVGYGKSTTITLKKLVLQDSRVLNAACAGGTVGICDSLGTLAVSDSQIKNVVVYTQGATAYDGSAKAGGITGNNIKSVTVSDVTMEGVTVVADGNVGLVNGFTKSSGILRVTNFSAKSCIVVTTQNERAAYFWAGNTNPGAENASKGTSETAGSAGIFIGACAGDDAGKYEGDLKELTAFNVRIADCIVGYYTGDAQALHYTENSGTWSFKDTTLSEKNIGVYLGANSGIAYADFAYTKDNTYTNGKLGLLIGGARGLASDGKLQIVGLSVQGAFYPFEENGYDNQGIDDSENSYVIYADYTGACAGEKPNTTGTVNKDYTSGYTDSIAAPYVVVNAASELTVYAQKTGTTGQALLTGDGMVWESIHSILSDAAGTTAEKTYNRTYHRIEAAAEQFTGDGSYVDNLNGYYDASESNQNTNGYSGNLADFPVLLVDSGRTADITAMVNAYVSVLTGCDQTGTGGASARYTSIVPHTYQWDATAHRFVKAATASLSYNSTFKTLSVVGSLHDNQNNQFTLLDVYYKNPNADQGYHLYIPVVVKRVLQVDFSVKMLTGSSTYASIYQTNSALLASYGENYTTQLTYSYTWTAAEWNAYISGGGNLLWSYDKQVQLDTGISTGAADNDLKQSTTRLTLVDPNRYGPGDTYFIGTGTVLTQDADSDTVLEFNNLAGFTSMYIGDLLSLSAVEDSAGSLKVTGTGSADDPVPAGSSIRVWNGDSFTYYGLKTGSDAADTRYYTLTLVDENQKPYEDGADVVVSEIYYLTVNCTEGDGVHARLLSLGETRLTSTDANALPTRTKSSGSRYYTLGDFYEISETDIDTVSENNTPVVELTDNDYIDVKVSAKVSVSADQAEDFRNYASGVNSYFRFAVRLNDGSSASPIVAPGIHVESLKIGEQELTASDYTGMLSGGVYYLTITSQKASAYQNQTVTATIRFSYEDDAAGISEQFPERTSDEDTAGVNFSVDAAIAYSPETIEGSSMSGSDVDGTKYHREKIELVSLTYNSYNTASVDGNTSQLGINGREVAGNNGQSITSLGMFNATQMSSLELTDDTSEKYPSQLACSLTLEKKTDQSDGSTKYEQVDIGTYLEGIAVYSAGNAVSGKLADDGTYGFTVLLTDEQIQNLSMEQVELDISYLVLSDEALEEIGDVGQYANYRVTLSAHLENGDGEALTEETNDYLIYTNAKFYLGIIGVTDLGQ